MGRYVTALTIAGSDSSGGAGVQADLKTMSALGVYGMTAITAITVQNTMGVRAVQGIDPGIVAGQIDAVYDDIRPDSVKIGMLFSTEIVVATAEALVRNRATNIVLDPVMVSTSGSKLIDDNAIEAVKSLLLPLSTIVTPNVAEAREITGVADPEAQITRLRELGANAILLKGGDIEGGDTSQSTDILSIAPGEPTVRLTSPRVATSNTHGTGCTLSSAIASYLALGYPLPKAVIESKQYISRALETGAYVTMGHGHGPVNHLFAPIPLTIIN
ncbi:MAG: bifunctional hydroxymethylpyrimidine kinase/phosphomethylpyrimidine kinase [Muribaculum sp.]|nr:bifunctional hydroxymethylpyrimidine kinase/phosphomethylpyrimidine kinase [Muribaculum sp.]